MEEIKKIAIDHEYKKKEQLLEKEFKYDAVKQVKIKRETHDLEQ